MEASSMMTVNDLASKFRAKSELINVLSEKATSTCLPKET